MAKFNNNLENKEAAPSSPEQVKSAESTEAKEGMGASRSEIAGTLAEGVEGGEMMDTGEKVSESAEGGRERKAQGVKKGDASTAATTKGDDDDDEFVFDEKNLPPAPKMIKMIEKKLRAEIADLEKQAKKYRGGWIFGEPDLPRLSETVGQIRDRNVLLKRIVTMAAEKLKKIFVKMFAPKKPQS